MQMLTDPEHHPADMSVRRRSGIVQIQERMVVPDQNAEQPNEECLHIQVPETD
jgi:hypothetical protein